MSWIIYNQPNATSPQAGTPYADAWKQATGGNLAYQNAPLPASPDIPFLQALYAPFLQSFTSAGFDPYGDRVREMLGGQPPEAPVAEESPAEPAQYDMPEDSPKTTAMGARQNFGGTALSSKFPGMRRQGR